MSADKRAVEAFRVRQHAGPHPALAAVAAGAAGGAGSEPASHPPPPAGGGREAAERQEVIEPDTGRVILHFDADSFYAQVEENRNPALRGRPLGVTQKYLIVTCNYAARQQGVTKLMGVAEAQRRCPGLALVAGEDLTPYRVASKQLLAVLQRYGTAEKLGLDEVVVDATAEARRRLAELGPGSALPPWHGHVHTSGTQLQQDSRHRPMDLRVAAAAGAGGAEGARPAAGAPSGGAPAGGSVDLPGAAAAPASAPPAASWEALLRVGSAIAAEARAAVRADAGIRTSAGVACNKVLAKLCSGLHKPDDQTVLPPPEAAAFLAPLPVRALSGVGYKTEGELGALGVSTCADLRALPRAQLLQRFGERLGSFLHAACRGKDPSPVVERGPPKSVTVEDSFRSCAGLGAAEQVLRVLAPDLLQRVQEEAGEGRRPATLSLKWRHRGSGWQRASASCPMPAAVLASRVPEEQQVDALVAAAMGLLRRHLPQPFDLSLINLGATAFSEASPAAAASTRSIADMLAGMQRGGGGQAAPVGSAQQPGAAQQHQDAAQQQQQHAAGGARQQAGAGAARWQQQWGQQGVLPASGRAAADASSQQRRSYSGTPAPAPLLSKRHERQLREQGAGEGPALAPAVAPPSLGPQSSLQLPVLPPASQQHGQQRAQHGTAQHGAAQHGVHGYGEEEEEEEEEDLLSELQGLASWRNGGSGSGRRRGTAGPGPVASGSMQLQQQHRWHEGPAGGGGGAAGAAAAAAGAGRRVVIHADADCFYCQVERLDDPSLAGVPLAVQQFNAGGFVAVSYEARAAGIRCGDGAGAAGRAAVPHLVRMQAASIEECRRRCPGLQVRPMRTERYRQVAQQVHDLVRSFAPDGQAQKTSYDDFYLEATAVCAAGSSAGGGDARMAPPGASPPPQQEAPAEPPAGLLVLGSPPTGAAWPPPDNPHVTKQQWSSLPGDLRRGVALAAALRSAAKRQLGITLSCGVARNKLLARLAGPLGKPDGLAVLPDAAALPFIRACPLSKVPMLRGKFGQAVAAELGAATVGDLAAFSRAQLVQRFGEQQGAFLAALPLAQDDDPVRERGPQKSLAAERSFPPLPSEAAAAAALAPLAHTLLARAAQDECCRLPSKLTVSYRQGYSSNPRSKSGAVPPVVQGWLEQQLAAGQPSAEQPPPPPQQPPPQQQQAEAVQAAMPAGAIVAAALALLRPAVAVSGWQLTRLALGFAYDAGGEQQAALPTGQRSLAGFVQRQGSKQLGEAADDDAAAPAAQQVQQQQQACQLPPEVQHDPQQQQQQQQQAPQPQHAPQQPSKPPATAPRPASYRSAEAVALQQLFASGSSSQLGALPASMPPEERASLELALRLQQEEARQAAAAGQAAAPRKRGAPPAGATRQRKLQRGPLDAFVRRGCG